MLCEQAGESSLDQEFAFYLNRRRNYANIKDVHKQVLTTLATPRGLPKLVKSIDAYREVFSDFDPFEVVEGLGNLSDDELVERVRPKHANHTNRLWRQFARGAVDGARLLTSFTNPNSLDASGFFAFVDLNAQNADDCWALAQALSEKIYGMGTVLACNFLKEVGISIAIKPDVQLIEIFSKIRLIPSSTKSLAEAPYRTFLAGQKIALANQVQPFLVDKMYWILGAGKWENSIGGVRPKLKYKYIDKVKTQILPKYVL